MILCITAWLAISSAHDTRDASLLDEDLQGMAHEQCPIRWQRPGRRAMDHLPGESKDRMPVIATDKQMVPGSVGDLTASVRAMVGNRCKGVVLVSGNNHRMGNPGMHQPGCATHFLQWLDLVDVDADLATPQGDGMEGNHRNVDLVTFTAAGRTQTHTRDCRKPEKTKRHATPQKTTPRRLFRRGLGMLEIVFLSVFHGDCDLSEGEVISKTFEIQ